MGKTSQKQKEKRLAGRVSLALAAGMFSVVPVAHGMPTFDKVNTHNPSGTTITFGGTTATSGSKPASGAEIRGVGSSNNVVIDWKDFSVANGEHVNFANDQNFMNIVTGKATSDIEGRITGNNIYLINPNGVIFGSTAQINVGNLYVSTREASNVDIDGFVNGTVTGASVLPALTADGAKLPQADIVNLIDEGGSVKADTVVMEGRNIRFLNINTVQNAAGNGASNITLRSNKNTDNYTKGYTDGYIHVGHRVGEDAGNYNVGYVNSAENRNKDESTGVVEYTLVYNSKTDGDHKILLTDVSTGGNYMLAEDIDASSTTGCNMTSPIGDSIYNQFTGKFDGMFHTVNDLKIGANGTTYIGLFGYTNGARIENVGVKNVELKSRYAGGIVGSSNNSTLLNVWNESGKVGNQVGYFETVGGIIGCSADSILNNSYNAAHIYGVGLVGQTNDSFIGSGRITNSYNVGELKDKNGVIKGVLGVNPNDHTVVNNVYTASRNSLSFTEQLGGNLTPNEANRYILDTSFPITISSFTSASTDGGSGATWRLYQGTDQLPLLTAFFKGTVSTDYDYKTFSDATTPMHADSMNYEAANLPHKTYEAAAVGATNVTLYGMGATATDLTNGTIKQNDNKNAGTFALFYGGQQGYDLYGNNFTIDKRRISVNVTSTGASKVYDGTATRTVSGATLAGSFVNADDVTKDGIMAADRGTVALTGNVTYTYVSKPSTNPEAPVIADKDVGQKTVTVTASADLDVDNPNYQLVDLSADTVDAEITKRSVVVSLYQTEGINKTYDGTATVTDESKQDITGLSTLVGEGNINTATALRVDTDNLTQEQITDLFNSEVVFSKDGVTSQYVADDGTTPASNVADAKKVAYAGVSIADKVADSGRSANYQLMYEDADGNLQAVTDGTLYAGGAITPLEISSNDIIAAGGAVTKTEYDGLSTSTLSASEASEYTFTFKDGVLKGNDGEKLVLTPTLTDGKSTVTFYHKTVDAETGEATYIETADATESGLDTAANSAKLNVTLGVVAGATDEATAANAKALQNYKWKETSSGTTVIHSDTQLTAGDMVNTGGVTGVINKRAIAVKLGNTTVADAQYDGDDVVEDVTGKAYNTFGGDYAQYDGTKTIVTDFEGNAPTISVESVKYLVTEGDDGVAKNVAFDASGNEIAKDIRYTIALTGEKSANYTLNGNAATLVDGNWKATAALNGATGKITRRELTMTVADAPERFYNGSEFVDTPIPAVTLENRVDGETVDNIIDTTKIVGRYGTVTTDGFTASADAGTYTATTTTGKKVLYTGVKVDGTENTYYDINTALKKTGLGRNYKITNTVYGKGEIKKRSITKAELEAWVDPTGKALTRVYNGTGQYIAAELADVDKSTLLPDSDAALGIMTADVGKVLEKITIAGAIYANGTAPEVPGADVGEYDNVTVTFNIAGDELTNYDCYTGDFEKAGYSGNITPINLTAALRNDWTPEKTYDTSASFVAGAGVSGVVIKKADGVTVAGKTINDLFSISDSTKIVTGDEVGISIDSATVEDANAGSKTITYKIKSTNDNYTFTDGTTNSLKEMTGVGTINKRHVVVTGVGDVYKDYDTTAAVTLDATDDPDKISNAISIAFANAASNADGLAVPATITDRNPVQGQYGYYTDDTDKATFYADANVNRASSTESAGGKAVRYTGVVGGTSSVLKDNYVIDDGMFAKTIDGVTYVYGTGKINPASRTVTVTSISKVYDGNDVIEKDDLTFGTTEAWVNNVTVTAGNYASKNVTAAGGENLSTALALGYSEGGTYNYNVTTGSVPSKGIITKKDVTVYLAQKDDVTAQKEKITKTYNAADDLNATSLANAQAEGWVVSDGFITGDNVWVKAGTVKYVATATGEAAKDANENKAVTYSGFVTQGTDAGNYNVTTTSLSGVGVINKKNIEFGIDDDTLFEKFYNKKTTFSDTNNNDLHDLAMAWWAGDGVHVGVREGTDDFGLKWEHKEGEEVKDEGYLVGVYGTWTPSTTTTAPGTFKENSHVKYVDDDITKDVTTQNVYYTVALTDEAAKNYIITNGTAAKVLNADGSTRLENTKYFTEAMGTGKIKPLAVTMANVSSNSSDIYKVYDGSTSVEGLYYDATTGAIGPKKTIQDYFKVFYDADKDGVFDDEDFDLGYAVIADFNSPNANMDTTTKTVITYGTFAFDEPDAMGDYTLDPTMLDNYYNGTDEYRTTVDAEAGNGANRNGDGHALPTEGNIARRLLVVKPDSMTVNHTKPYDTTDKVTNASAVTYTVNQRDVENDDGTGRVGDDVISITYTANFASTNGEDAEDVNIAATNLYKNVEYVYKLNDATAANYTLAGAGNTTAGGVVSADGKTLTYTQSGKSKITPKEVEVRFVEGVNGTFNKTYDGSSSIIDEEGNLIADGYETRKLADILSLTGVYDVDGAVALNFADGSAPTADYYVNGTKNAAGHANARLGVSSQDVYIQNLNLTGAGSHNYVIKTAVLKGKGEVGQRAVNVELKDDGSVTPITKVYDRSEKVEDYDGHTYLSDNVQYGTVVDPSTADGGFIVGDEALGLGVESAIYYNRDAAHMATGSYNPDKPEDYATYNAGAGLGVSYRLKWNNKDYTLARVLYSANGEIKKRTLEYKDETSLSVDKTYDGTKKVKDVSSVSNGLFTNMIDQDVDTLLTIDDSVSQYDHANTGATSATGKNGTPQPVTVTFSLNNNYQLAEVITPGQVTPENAEGGFYTKATYTGTGRINRAQVTMTPTEVSYYPSQLATATYTGQAAGFVNGDNRPTVTYGRDGNTSASVGKYTLLGYVNGKRVPVNGETFADGFENYYFTTTQNSALTILAEPVKPDVPVVPDIPTVLPDMGNKPVTKVVTESVISDTKFTPDEYSYNRMSKDSDTTHVNRVSSATLQYSEKGVNLDGDDTKSGLASLADIQGRGSVVNLNGALIQTSAPAEQPEKVAETAALPISETDTTEDATSMSLPEKEENDDSSIGLEYADNTGGSQSVLEILTNASSKAENKGTSIVIDTQDEDAEAEKTRRAIFADRSNIGIETLGNAVNLNQMIG